MFKKGPLKWVAGGVLLLLAVAGFVVVSDLRAVRDANARMPLLHKRVLALEEKLAESEKLPPGKAAARLCSLRAECVQVAQELEDARVAVCAVRIGLLAKDQAREWTELTQREMEVLRRLDLQYNAAVQQLVNDGAAEP